MEVVREPRVAIPALSLNGADWSGPLEYYLQEATFTEVASGSSDEIEVTLYNFDMEWLQDKLPQVGDIITGFVALHRWNSPKEQQQWTPAGDYVIDKLSFHGGPLEATIGGLSVPADSSFQIRPRTQTWQDTTLSGLLGEIAGRYGLMLKYNGPEHQIAKIEQSQQTDSAFAYDTVKKYGMKMKIYCNRMIVYESMHADGPVATLTREDWIDDGWSYERCIEGAYSGARISYKSPDSDDEISIYQGFVAEDAPEARTMWLNETCDNEADAINKIRAEVNRSNEEIETISGDLWPRTDVAAGVNIQISGLGSADGKYFVTKNTYTFSADNGLRQTIEAYKYQTRL